MYIASSTSCAKEGIMGKADKSAVNRPFLGGHSHFFWQG